MASCAEKNWSAKNFELGDNSVGRDLIVKGEGLLYRQQSCLYNGHTVQATKSLVPNGSAG